MKFDIQRADFWKRASALLLDIILLVTLAVGIAAGMSFILGYDDYFTVIQDAKDKYCTEYGVDFDNVTKEQLDAMTEEERQPYVDADKAYSSDPEVVNAHSMLVSLALLIVSISFLLSYICLEVVVPIIFKNGVTVGKKVFGLAVIRTNGVRLSGQALFIRTVLGKYTMETMVPLFIALMSFLGTLGILGVILLVLILALEIFTVFYTKTRSTIHDLISDTVVVDMASQMIFNSEEELTAYKTRIHAEEVARSDY